MAVKTTLERLEAVQTAITNALEAEEVAQSNGTRVRRQSLEILFSQEKILLKQYKAETGEGLPAVNYAIVRRD